MVNNLATVKKMRAHKQGIVQVPVGRLPLTKGTKIIDNYSLVETKQ